MRVYMVCIYACVCVYMCMCVRVWGKGGREGEKEVGRREGERCEKCVCMCVCMWGEGGGSEGGKERDV